MKVASKLFLDSLQGGGSHYMYCGHCGKEHFCPDADIVINGDDSYDTYLEIARTQVKRGTGIIHNNCDFVYAKDILGVTIPVDCPCNGLGYYEQLIWESRKEIHAYITTRVAAEIQWAKEKEVVDKLAGINTSSLKQGLT